MLATSLLFLILSTTFQDDDEPWEAVTFKEGGFTVEMPAIGEQEGKTPFGSPAGQGTLNDHLRQTGGVIYNVRRYVSPRPIPKAEESRWFDFGRDKAEGISFRGKVVSEKKIQIGSLTGREYVFRSESGTSRFETRGRSFIKGSTLIVLLVTGSTSNKPLPPKADRFLESFAFGTKPSDAGKAAARAGEEAEDRRKATVPWKVVKLLGDKATVEMPSETSMTGGGGLDAPLSRFFSMSTNAEGAGVEYSALAFQGENALAAKDEAKALVVARERAVGHFGSMGKVISEHPITTRAGEGREYEMTIERRPGVAVKARCRAYVDGGMILIVIAVSKAKGKDVPPEAGRFLDSLVVKGRGGEVVAQLPGPPGGNKASLSAFLPLLKLYFGSTRTSLLMGVARLGVSRPMGNRPPGGMPGSNPPANGATTPRAEVAKIDPPAAKPTPTAPKPNPLKAWGTEVDPDGDVSIETSGRSLTMTIPGTAHVLAPERDKMNAPRITTPIQGDLTVIVRVDGAFQPNPKSTVKGLSTRQAGGLILWKDSGNYLVFQHRASVDEGKIVHQAVIEELVGGDKGVTHRQAIPEGATYLRLERKRGRITASFSATGKDWKEMKPVDTTWATGEVQVGVMGVNSSLSAHEITFEDYSLKSR